MACAQTSCNTTSEVKMTSESYSLREDSMETKEKEPQFPKVARDSFLAQCATTTKYDHGAAEHGGVAFAFDGGLLFVFMPLCCCCWKLRSFVVAKR